jgi:hypothetical protein
MYRAREVQGKRSMSRTCFENLERWLSPQWIRRSVDVDVKQGDNQVRVGGVNLALVSPWV